MTLFDNMISRRFGKRNGNKWWGDLSVQTCIALYSRDAHMYEMLTSVLPLPAAETVRQYMYNFKEDEHIVDNVVGEEFNPDLKSLKNFAESIRGDRDYAYAALSLDFCYVNVNSYVDAFTKELINYCTCYKRGTTCGTQQPIKTICAYNLTSYFEPGKKYVLLAEPGCDGTMRAHQGEMVRNMIKVCKRIGIIIKTVHTDGDRFFSKQKSVLFDRIMDAFKDGCNQNAYHVFAWARDEVYLSDPFHLLKLERNRIIKSFVSMFFKYGEGVSNPTEL